MKFTTENSAYEVNLVNKEIRRLKGSSDPTPRQGEDGVWKKYEDISKVRPGEPVIIIWPPDKGLAKTTVTSAVVKIGV
jgi:hypothetical protein